jgi:UDP-3-O-[3-hydroxymyristoyl] glucosamine N-acyltransferase
MRLIQLAELVKAELRGSESQREQEISRVSAMRDAGPDAIVFAEDVNSLRQALETQAGAIITSAKLAEEAGPQIPLLIAKQPKLAFARAARAMQVSEPQPAIHSTAVVDGSVLLERRVSIGAYAVVEAGARIGEDTKIEAGAVVGAGVVIGRKCRIYPRAVIYSGTEIGDRVVVHAGAVLGSDGFGYVRDEATGEYLQFPQQGRLVIEDDVEIGANTTIDRGALEETRIARGVKIDNLVHIGHNVLVGQNVVIAAQTGISGSSVIESGAVVGGQVGIGDHAVVGEQVILGSGSGVLTHKKVKGAGVVFWGRPARPLPQYLKELATLSSLARSEEGKPKKAAAKKSAARRSSGKKADHGE